MERAVATESQRPPHSLPASSALPSGTMLLGRAGNLGRWPRALRPLVRCCDRSPPRRRSPLQACSGSGVSTYRGRGRGAGSLRRRCTLRTTASSASERSSSPSLRSRRGDQGQRTQTARQRMPSRGEPHCRRSAETSHPRPCVRRVRGRCRECAGRRRIASKHPNSTPHGWQRSAPRYRIQPAHRSFSGRTSREQHTVGGKQRGG
mmetsp:Transcript_36221/g.95476  ORF Transcript_36221/g.95476 Transcript_36221/m.95476 type:complete len:205 (+) Transcript_36221:847-1461(+)